MVGGRGVAGIDVGGVVALRKMNVAVVVVVLIVTVVMVVVVVMVDDVSPVDVEEAEERGVAERFFVGGEAARGAAVVTAHVR